MGMNAGKLDRVIQIRRYTEEDDGFGKIKVWADHGAAIWAQRVDVSDQERFAASQVQATITTRFTVRSSEFSRDISPRDRIRHEGQDFNITGVKESKDGRLRFIELTASARADQ